MGKRAHAEISGASPAQVANVIKALPAIVLKPEDPQYSDAVARRNMLTTVITTCLQQEDHILTIHSIMQQRINIQNEVQLAAAH